MNIRMLTLTRDITWTARYSGGRNTLLHVMQICLGLPYPSMPGIGGGEPSGKHMSLVPDTSSMN